MYLKSLFLFFLCSILSFHLVAQEQEKTNLDSLVQIIDTTQIDSVKAINIIEWARQGRVKSESMKEWVKIVPPLYLRHLDTAAVYFAQQKDTSRFLSSLAHIATYNIQTPDSTENHSLERYRFIRGTQGITVKNNLIRPDSSGEYLYWSFRSEFLVLEDSSQSLSFDDILNPEYQHQFKGNHTMPIGFKKHPKGRVFWLKVKLKSENTRDDDYYFSIGDAEQSWRNIDIYIQDSTKEFIYHRSGNDIPTEEKMVPDWRNNFKIFIPKKEIRWVYIRLENPARIMSPLAIRVSQVNPVKILQEEMITLQINGVFFGMVFIQAIFFIFLFFTTRIKYYFYYIIFLLGVAMVMILTNYLAFLMPAWIEFMLIANTITATILAIGLLYFAFHFLEVGKLSTRWIHFLRILSITLVILSGHLCWRVIDNVNYVIEGGEGNPMQNAISMILAVTLIALISMVFWSIKAHIRGHKSAKYLLMGMGVMLFGIGTPLMSPIFQTDWMAFDNAIISIQVSIILQLAFFALALGQQRNELEQEKRSALEEKLGLQEKINAASAKFVPFEFIRSLGKETILDVKLGDATEKEVTVFFSDIRGYTSLVENMSPEENFRFINDFHKTVGPSISMHQGFVNQYLGDGIMAIFLESQDHALKAAIEIQQKVYNYTPLIPGDVAASLKLGMGLHAGSLMMGIIGDDKRTDAATISDTVNTASRMEGLTKYYGAPILLSGEVKTQLSDDYALRYLGKAQAKGKGNHVDVFECLEGRSLAEQEIFQKTLTDFQAGIQAYYSKDFKGARDAFQLILSQNKLDMAARLYYDKSLQYLEEEIAEDWDGVMLMENK